MARAALQVARLVERKQDFGDKLATFGQHSLDHVGCRVFEAGQI